MFHWRDNTYFGRRADGSVRIVKFKAPQDPSLPWPQADAPEYTHAAFDVTVPAAEWASIVSTVSVTGETSQSYQLAVAFHG